MTMIVGKTRLSVTAVYSNGIPMLHESEFLADCFERKAQPGLGKTLLAFSVPAQLAQSLKDALQRGDVELLIENVPSPTERATL